MFNTFSGSSKRHRNVNLSGRSNPHSALGGSQNALATAQQNRVARQQERERTQAATVLQKTWRKHKERESLNEAQRHRWDGIEESGVAGNSQDHDRELTPSYTNDREAVEQLHLLLRFINLRNDDDFKRLRRYISRLQKSLHERAVASSSGPWPAEYLRLSNICLGNVTQDRSTTGNRELLDMSRFLISQMSRPYVGYLKYYATLVELARFAQLEVDDIVDPLITLSTSTGVAYNCFSKSLLELPTFRQILGHDQFELLASRINCRLLGEAVSRRLQRNNNKMLPGSTEEMLTRKLWLLAHFIFLYRSNYKNQGVSQYASDRNFVFIVGSLLSSLVNFVEIETTITDNDSNSTRSEAGVDPFVRDQIASLLNQESVAGALTLVQSTAIVPNSSIEDSMAINNGTQILTNYILTLLRLFPRRGDEIRMWLYLGVLPDQPSAAGKDRSSVIRYFWNSASRTEVYAAISRDPKEVIGLVKPRNGHARENTPVPRSWLISEEGKKNMTDANKETSIDNQWRVIIMFIEMYMFVLKIMDDEQFFSGGGSAQIFKPTGQTNALLLTEVQALTIFLKNLGFTLYYNSREIMELVETDDQEEDIGRFFHIPDEDTPKPSAKSRESKSSSIHVAGVQGMSIDYLKGLVTGLVRAIYERDSRRPFLPKDHWLMTSRFDMTNFIDAVVEEEERRHKVQAEDDEDNSDDEALAEESPANNFVGTRHAQRTRRTEKLLRQRRKVSRMQHLQRIAPRLEILQNMPFFIPFTTRVQIFRRFILMDQNKGTLAPTDVFGRPGARHYARIRRKHEFEDAYEQYFKIGAALKEPIQISFVDQFNTVEAGIDGGGVTKEFLTSVTNQAFTPSDGIDMFAENDHHLLYPNPSAIEEKNEILAAAGIPQNSAEHRGHIAELLRRYEFLGRIIGKCLYEGILVDIGFATFFLLKWALTGGRGSAPRESGYRANINDLRDFDEGLYQGLVRHTFPSFPCLQN